MTEGAEVKKAPKRTEVLAGIDKVELKHAETVDKSGPVIDENAKVRESGRPQLMEEIQKKAK